MREKQQHVPVIGIQEFRKIQFTGRNELLYIELHGKRSIEKPHKHDFFIINLFEKAQGIHTIDFNDYEIKDKQIHLLFPGQIHKWQINAQTIAYQLMIEPIFFERFANYLRFSITEYSNHPVFNLSENSFKLLKHEFEAIKDELQTGNSLKELINARAAVIAAIVSKEAENFFNDFKVHQSNPKLVKFNTLIEQHFRAEKRINFYASRLHISDNYLNILSKKHLGVSAMQLIQQRVLLEAKRLLHSTALSIKEIAFELGFVDHAYFSNFFKNQTGATPTAFREK